jgi:hypothetical protein
MTRAEVERAFTAHKDAVYRFAWRMAPGRLTTSRKRSFCGCSVDRSSLTRRAARCAACLLGVARNLALQHLRVQLTLGVDRRGASSARVRFEVRLKADTTRQFEIGELVGRACERCHRSSATSSSCRVRRTVAGGNRARRWTPMWARSRPGFIARAQTFVACLHRWVKEAC